MNNITAEHILLSLIVALSGWTLKEVVSLKVQLAALPCRKCGVGTALVAALLLAPICCAAAASNVIDQAEGLPTASDLQKGAVQLAHLVPWQSVFDWFAGIALPALVLLWRRFASKHAKVAAALGTVINAVEKSGPVAANLKELIRAQAVQDGTQPDLHREVKKTTE